MKTTWKLGILVGIGALAVSQASANLVINGDFESGPTGFTSGYLQSPPSSMYDPGTYTIGTDPSLVHSAWNVGPHSDHTPGLGTKMMIVNGTEQTGLKVWEGQLSPDMVVGTTYKFSFWVASIYSQAPAVLDISIGGVSLGTFTPQSIGTWEHFTATFVAGANHSTALINQNTAYSGNDFALDDICLTAVPEPSTYLAGALLLLPFGVSTVRSLRRNRE